MLQINLTQDIHLTDIGLKERYYTLFFNGDINGARNLLAENLQLDTKVLSEKNLNSLVNGINELEDYYYTTVTDVLNKHISDYQISIDELIYMNNYSATVQYTINNFILYNKGIYFCIKTPPIGTIPTDIIYWLNLGLKGISGKPNLGVKYIGKWDESKEYYKYNMVVYNNKIFVSKTTNKNKNPITSSTDWFVAMELKPQGIYTGMTEPIKIKSGEVWFKYL